MPSNLPSCCAVLHPFESNLIVKQSVLCCHLIGSSPAFDQHFASIVIYTLSFTILELWRQVLMLLLGLGSFIWIVWIGARLALLIGKDLSCDEPLKMSRISATSCCAESSGNWIRGSRNRRCGFNTASKGEVGEERSGQPNLV